MMAKYGAPDRPLKIGDIRIPAYVLSDGTRVLAQRGLQGGIGLSEGGGKGGARKIVELLTNLEERGIDIKGLISRANNPIKFVTPNGPVADGYEFRSPHTLSSVLTLPIKYPVHCVYYPTARTPCRQRFYAQEYNE